MEVRVVGTEFGQDAEEVLEVEECEGIVSAGVDDFSFLFRDEFMDGLVVALEFLRDGLVEGFEGVVLRVLWVLEVVSGEPFSHGVSVE